MMSPFVGGYEGPKAGGWRAIVVIVLVVLAGGTILVIASYRGIQSLGDTERELRRMAEADPAADADAALAGGDRRFLGFRRIGSDLEPFTRVPGVRGEDESYVEKHGSRAVGIVRSAPDAKELEDAAHRYVVSYNKRLLERLKAEE